MDGRRGGRKYRGTGKKPRETQGERERERETGVDFLVQRPSSTSCVLLFSSTTLGNAEKMEPAGSSC